MSEENDIQTINSALQDSAPEVAVAPDGRVTLIRGLCKTVDGVETWHTEAVVRELTGADEEYLSSVANRKNATYSEYMTAILSSAVVSIGDIEIKKNNALVDKLILADRDVLYLAILRVTYGVRRSLKVPCVSCSEKNEVIINLDTDFDFKDPEFDVRVGIPVTTSNGTVTLRVPTGEDTTAIAKHSGNEAELNTLMLSRCAVFSADEAPTNRTEWARSLNISDRRILTSALADLEIGPIMGEVDTQCAYCEANLPVMLDWVSLLLG